MSLVKVWNDNTLPFIQEFKGEKIHIPAKSYIEMEWEEANSFKGIPSPMVFDGMGQPKPEGFKMIRIEGRPKFDDKVIAYKSHLDGSLHSSKESLEAHNSGYSHLRAPTPTSQLEIVSDEPSTGTGKRKVAKPRAELEARS